MYATSFVNLALASLAIASPQGVPDKPIVFWARLYADSADCSGAATYSYLSTQGNCINRTVPGTGSAIIRIGEVGKYYLAGWTESDCKGKVVLVETSPGVCIDLGGTEVKSWSDDLSPFGEEGVALNM
ncbi:uncharacterized protein B0J16DRAFT_404773 [Fusarium flagelliforme]|uniref:uncharacterized protein n=1 Tax=Fusarium flagelliforme TaxID=2675880 RepID=UPI001E8EA3A1|nr:uncharacterized protein B0J16DRAFT_404773 [Fusarium flagelliforme]KAH7174930.1 hypothetical protein B0J16DRAFT_404773 [Fusarium flagelliforme]